MDLPIQDIKVLAVVDFGDLVDSIISDVIGKYKFTYKMDTIKTCRTDTKKTLVTIFHHELIL